MPRKVATRAGVEPFRVMEVMKAAAARAAEGSDVLHLEVGQPGTPAPAAAIAAAHAALDRERLGYTDAAGTDQLRNRISAYYADRHDVRVPVERVFVTAGASGACVLAFLTAFAEGDRVAVTEPGYPCYRNMLSAFGIEPVGIPIGADTDFRITPDLLAGAGPLDGLIVASPSNPTGTVLHQRELAAVAAWCDDHDVRLVSDEIYADITFGAPAPSALSTGDEHIVVNSFSKYFSMTGWRIGWLVVPSDLIVPIERLAQNLFISPPTLAQVAALAAFDATTELDAHVARYARNRDILLDGLRAAGIDQVAPPDGAFYVYADVSHLTDDSEALAREWLHDIGVAVTSGIDFDPRRGSRFLRLSFCGTEDEIADAARRIAAWGRAT
ncbi:MAG TPA: aminotransferase class I/II-fold pyridoxal phosphate-dependent enzyme [Acidimicrobiales bacterium]|nr:aminotransferase class I/II-fold pyridoxal phosphate-dependent enzyme [Acidimicrobiales bacterium]